MKLCFFRESWTKGCKQIPEIKQISFCIEPFTAGFLQVFNKNVKIWLFSVRLDTRHEIQAFQELS